MVTQWTCVHSIEKYSGSTFLPFLSQKPHRPLRCTRGRWAGCIANPSRKGFDITWAGTLIASCDSRTISYRSVLDNAPCRRLCSSHPRSHCRLRLENLWSKDSSIFIRRQDFWPNFSPHKKTLCWTYFKEKHRHAPTYLGEVAFMQTGVTLCNVAIFLEVGSIISRISISIWLSKTSCYMHTCNLSSTPQTWTYHIWHPWTLCYSWSFWSTRIFGKKKMKGKDDERQTEAYIITSLFCLLIALLQPNTLL